MSVPTIEDRIHEISDALAVIAAAAKAEPDSVLVDASHVREAISRLAAAAHEQAAAISAALPGKFLDTPAPLARKAVR